MQDAEDLEALPARELHDRAIKLAVQRRDMGFLWELLKVIPAAEAAAGHVDRGENNLLHVSALITDLMRSGSDDLGEALRPLYIRYLSEHAGA